MPVAWRIVQRKHEASAMSGQGAKTYGGRWNNEGTAIVYTASSRALAAYEMLVHVANSGKLRDLYVCIGIEYPEKLVEVVSAEDLPLGWDKTEHPFPKAFGDVWVREARSVILQVPSVLIPQEPNLLINPAHSDFSRLAVRSAEPFRFDERLAQAETQPKKKRK